MLHGPWSLKGLQCSSALVCLVLFASPLSAASPCSPLVWYLFEYEKACLLFLAEGSWGYDPLPFTAATTSCPSFPKHLPFPGLHLFSLSHHDFCETEPQTSLPNTITDSSSVPKHRCVFVRAHTPLAALPVWLRLITVLAELISRPAGWPESAPSPLKSQLSECFL